MKKKSPPGKTVDVVAASLFTDTDNAAKQLLAATEPVFEAGWQLERQRLLDLYHAYDQLKTDYRQELKEFEAAGDWDGARELEKNNYERRFLSHFVGEKMALSNQVGPNEYARYKEAVRLNEQIQRKGFEASVAGLKEVATGLWLGNLRRVLERQLLHTYPKARLINVRPAEQGFEITAYVDSRRFRIHCLGAGGKGPIVFHYRFLVNFQE